MATAYADFLLSKSYKQEAGLMYLKAQQFESAVEAFSGACQWQHAVCALYQLEHKDTARIATWARDMAGKKSVWSGGILSGVMWVLVQAHESNNVFFVVKLSDQRQTREAALLLHQYAQVLTLCN